MIEFFKLAKLPRTQRLKKTIKILEQLEQNAVEDCNDEMLELFYLKQLYKVFYSDLSTSLQSKVKHFFYTAEVDPASVGKSEIIGLLNVTRHYLYALTGVEVSDWDLILPHKNSANENTLRKFFPHIFVYAETIRSPFNLGSIFRTSDAFGAEKIFLSPDCVSPENKRAQRSAMACIDYVPYERKALSAIVETFPQNFPVIALETGGTEINEFVFPSEGMVLLGSEELGLSPEALSTAQHRVSIKMHGIKASINVGVAFGIFMEHWAHSLMLKQTAVH